MATLLAYVAEHAVDLKIVASKVDVVDNRVQTVDGKVQQVDGKVQQVDDKVEQVGDNVRTVADYQCDEHYQVTLSTSLSFPCLLLPPYSYYVLSSLP
jgi:hypothetical protein